MPTYSWTLVPPPLVILIARAVDARIVDLVWQGAPNEAASLNPANYSILPGPLTVTGVEKLTASTYRLFTSRQTPGTLYTITTSNI